MGKKFMKKLLVLMAAMCMVITMSVSAIAAEPETDGIEKNVTATTDDPTDGILQVYLTYVNDDGERTLLFGGTCFLINEEYVLSNYHIFDLNSLVEVQSEDNPNETVQVPKRDVIMATLGLDELPDNDPHLKVYVYANRDMGVEATIHDSVQSETMDFVALKLADKIYDRKPLVLGDSSIMKQQDVVYALGFPSDSIENKEFNTKADVSVVDGTISKVTTRDKADVFEHTAQLNSGNSGGPLLNGLNEVIGINTFVRGNDLGTKSYTVQINALKSGLDTFGISYADGTHDRVSLENGVLGTQTDGGEIDVETEETTGPDPALVEELQNEIAKANAIDKDGYTEESVQVLNDTISNAESIVNNTEATDDQIQTAISDLQAAVNGLEEQSGPNLILIIGIVAAVIVIIVVVIIIIVVTNGNKKKKAKIAGNGPVPPIQQTPPVQPVSPGPVPVQPASQMQQAAPEGAGETTLLDSGAGETTLLSGAGGGAYLIRKKNGEKIQITSQNFAIGKERRRVNYCISDNTSVSRYHVVIMKKGSDYYAADQKSSNFTFVNGVQLSPYKETLLTDRSTLKLSDEEFEFHVS